MKKLLTMTLLCFVTFLFGAKIVLAIEIEANVKWDDKHVVQFVVDGVVERVEVNQGDVFEKGDTLISLDLSPFQTKVKMYKAEIRALTAISDDAARELKEANTLYEQTVLSDVELQQAKIKYQIAKANLDKGKTQLQSAEWKLKHAKFDAPWSGFVLEKHVLPGQVVSKDKNETPLLTLVRSDNFRAVAWVEKSLADTLTLNNKVKVKVEGRAHTGVIKSLKRNMLNTLHKDQYQLTVEFESNDSQPVAAGQAVTIVLP